MESCRVEVSGGSAMWRWEKVVSHWGELPCHLPPCRPKKTWRQCMEEYLEALGITGTEAMDRNRKKFIIDIKHHQQLWETLMIKIMIRIMIIKANSRWIWVFTVFIFSPCSSSHHNCQGSHHTSSEGVCDKTSLQYHQSVRQKDQ